MAKLLSGTRVYGNLAVDTFVAATGNVTSSGNVAGTYLLGNVYYATGFSASKIYNGTSEVNIGTSGGAANISIGGTSNVVVISSTDVAITGNLSVSGNATLSGNILGDRLQNGTTSIDIQTASGNANISVAGTSNVVVFSSAGQNVSGYITSSGNITGGNLITAGQTVATGNVTGGNLITAGLVSATGNVTGNYLKATGNVEIQSRGILYLNDSDNSNYVGLRSVASLTGNYVFILPSNYGNADQVLATNGAGGMSWVDQSGGGGGGSATSYPNSTVSPVPGATGNFDLSYDFVQTSQETPFETSAVDPFGVNLGEVYSMMDPVGEILDPVDLGAVP